MPLLIILSECVDHVKDLYGIPISRVQFADDYRIVYIRKDDVTMILGVCLKSGKDKDYSRYDSVAKKISTIYLEADMLKNGLLPSNSQHYKVLKILLDSYEKDKNGCKNKKTK